MKKSYILLGLTIGLTTLIPLPLPVQAQTTEEIAQMVGAMTWCTNNVAKNRSEASIYQSARRAGDTKLQAATTNSQYLKNILEQVEKSGNYQNQKLDKKDCQEISQQLLNQ